MSRYANNPQCIMWYLKNSDHQLNYKLILTDSTTYNVKDLNVKQLLFTMQWNGFKSGKQDVKQTIICTSQAIFTNADYAQPDNAFE